MRPPLAKLYYASSSADLECKWARISGTLVRNDVISRLDYNFLETNEGKFEGHCKTLVKRATGSLERNICTATSSIYKQVHLPSSHLVFRRIQ